MKASIFLLAIFCFVLLSLNTNALIDRGETIPKTSEKKIEKEADKTIDRGQGENEERKVWSKYDFVPGDKIIVQDDLVGEQIGEFPSKWNLSNGNAEIAMLGDTKVISFVQNKTEITPLIKNEDYLPEIFTIEFDVYFYKKYNEAYFLKLKNSAKTGWHHIALSFNKRALKVYFDQTRVLNIPNIEKKPTSFSISALSHGASRGDPALIKDSRIAEGGVKLYDRLVTEGKIVTRGILFDSGKSTIKPESMGVINEIVKLMKDHPEINFSIEGHTDSDGEEAFNQKLSEQRAEAVKVRLINLGIDESRLQTKGWGESKAVDDNSTPEGKANNRRVEFIKI